MNVDGPPSTRKESFVSKFAIVRRSPTGNGPATRGIQDVRGAAQRLNMYEIGGPMEQPGPRIDDISS